ncbi:hypothetical protein F4604DRAFT_1677461 [Suillus subluteus]|nr:hypothetical protein F4604DRAFT_1677461 [Suillus subluteus]
MATGSPQAVNLLEHSIGIWPTQLPWYTEVVMLPPTYGNWQELVHPLDGTYYYHNTKNALTLTNLRRYLDLHSLKDFIDVYYYVVPDKQVIAWLEDLNSKLLFGECIQPSLELEAQYWKHFEFFPYQFQMESPQVRHIWREVVCYIREAMTLGQSSAASMFWTLDKINQIGTHLATIESLADNEIIEETGVMFCCRVLYILRT